MAAFIYHLRDFISSIKPVIMQLVTNPTLNIKHSWFQRKEYHKIITNESKTSLIWNFVLVTNNSISLRVLRFINTVKLTNKESQIRGRKIQF